MSENQHFGYGNAGKEANDFVQTIATNSSRESCEYAIQTFDSRRLQLRFLNPMPDLVYTGLPIIGKEGSPLVVALFDVCTGNFVNSGFEASAKVGMLVLDKTFDKIDAEDWTSDEFEAKVYRGIEGKTPLLAGNTCFNLNQGVGFVGKVYFRHTSQPLTIMQLKLGARIMACPVGTRIREAATESFTLKDRRIRNKMHYQLKLTDPVWRLVNVGRNGPFHKILQMENITTIQHFLYEYTANPQRLKNILGKSMSAKKLVATANHARTCNSVINDGGVIVDYDLFQMNASTRSYAPNSFMVSNSEGSNGTMFARFNQPLDIPDLGSTIDALDTSFFRGDDGDVTVDYNTFQMNASLYSNSPNSFMVPNSEGRNSSMSVGFNQPCIQDLGSTDEHLRHLVTSGADASAGGEIRVFNRAFDKNGTDNWTSYFTLQSAVNSFPVHAVVDKAQRRWTIVFSVVRCFSIRRLVVRNNIATRQDKESKTDALRGANSNGSEADASDMVISAFKNWHEVVTVDDEASVMDVSSCVSIADDSSNHPMLSNSDSSKVLTSHKNKRCDYPEPSTSSPDIIPSMYSLGTMTGLDDYGLQSMDSIDVRFDQTLGIPGQVANSIICDTQSMTQAFCEDEHLHFLNPDYTLQSSTMGSPNDLHSAVNSFLVGSVLRDKAQTRWKMLFSVLRWFSIRRLVARKYRTIKASYC